MRPASLLLVTGLAFAGQCQARADPSSAAQRAPRGPNPGRNPTRTFRLTSSGGIGFDDLWFSAERHALIAPAGGTGCIHLFDSGSLTQSSLCGIAAEAGYVGGHGEGTTSADVGAGLLFAIDRNTQTLQVADLRTQRVLGGAPLAGGPDYVRWLSSRRELWVTEPEREQIELFHVTSDNPPKLVASGTIAVKGGPESLIIDLAHERAFTHLWQGHTVQIALGTRAVGPSFANGCKGSRGIALDADRGQLFAGCAEGKAVVLDVDHAGAVLASQTTSSGVDIIAFNSARHHLYVPAASDGSVSVMGVGRRGKLSKLGTLRASKGAHCVVSDDRDRVWVCDPDAGSLSVFEDTFPVASE